MVEAEEPTSTTFNPLRRISPSMKLMVITDLHQNQSVLDWINGQIDSEKPDAVLFLGDITDFGTGEDAAEIISSINADVYAIPGNCDPLDLPQKVSGVATDMHGKATNLNGYRLVGLGGSNITIFKTPFELEEDTIYDSLKAVASEGMILMTHAPSYGILDQIPSGLSVGSPAVKRIVDEFHPILAVSGHIHEAVGVVEENGTVFVNPGPARENRCAFVSIDDGKVADVRLEGPSE